MVQKENIKSRIGGTSPVKASPFSYKSDNNTVSKDKLSPQKSVSEFPTIGDKNQKQLLKAPLL